MIEPKDVVARLMRRKRIWLQGKPRIILEGEPGQFGRLIFDFGDERIGYNIYIYDKMHIVEAAQTAIDNFHQLFVELTGD